MAFSYTLTYALRSPDGTSLAHPVTITDDAKLERDIVVADAVTNQLATLAIVRASTTYLELVSNANVTVKTNSTSSPGDTKTLLAGIPLIWHTGNGYTVPLAADVTQIYCSNSSGQQATVKLRMLSH